MTGPSPRPRRARSSRGPLPGAEGVEVDSPVDEQGALRLGAESFDSVEQRGRVGHHEIGTTGHVAVDDLLPDVRSVDVGSPRHHDQRRGAGERGEEAEPRKPVGVHHGRPDLPDEAPDPDHVAHEPPNRAAPCVAPRAPLRRLRAGETRERRFDVPTHHELEPALLHGDGEVLHMRMADGAQHEHLNARVRACHPATRESASPTAAITRSWSPSPRPGRAATSASTGPPARSEAAAPARRPGTP